MADPVQTPSEDLEKGVNELMSSDTYLRAIIDIRNVKVLRATGLTSAAI
ncbi:MAG TPA: hypothetical protein VGM27_13625 [Acidobacteriaceae bacterium]|jgi:hypothetical protein